MKLALLLFGLSKFTYRHWTGKNTSCNYKLSYDNYQEYIFNYFQEKGYQIDIYFSTNKLSSTERDELCEMYKPYACSFTDELSPSSKHDNQDINIHHRAYRVPPNVRCRNKKIDEVVDLCLNSNKHYDLVLITRFDLLFRKDFNQSNINLEKFNLVSILETPDAICDNFYLFPYKNLSDFSKIIKKYLNPHWIRNILENIYGKDHINYILNENREIAKLSFYKIIRDKL